VLNLDERGAARLLNQLRVYRTAQLGRKAKSA